MTHKLIAFDLDGTLLDSDKNLPEENLRALEKAAEKGVCLVPATGRIFSGIPEKIRSLPFIRYYITVNGAGVYDAWEDRLLYKREIEPALALRVIDYLKTLPVIYDCYQDGMGWMSRDMFEKAEEYISDRGILRLVRILRRTVDDLYCTLEDRNTTVQKLQCYFKDNDERKRQLELIPKLFPDIAVSSSVECNIEMNALGADKGSALKSLCDFLNIDIARSAAIGDGTNDLTMIKAAGTGVAMGNAEEEVKSAANIVTDSNNDMGAAKAIYRLI